jgi:hypothetical protein
MLCNCVHIFRNKSLNNRKCRRSCEMQVRKLILLFFVYCCCLFMLIDDCLAFHEMEIANLQLQHRMTQSSNHIVGVVVVVVVVKKD